MGTTEYGIIQAHRVKDGYVVHLPFGRMIKAGEILDEVKYPDILASHEWKFEPCVLLKKVEPMPQVPSTKVEGPVDLKDGAWAGRRCFILGGGPSLADIDVSRLRGELTIGINRAFELIDPTVICSMDSRLYSWILGGEFGKEATRKFKESLAHKIWLDTHGFKFGPEVQKVPVGDELKGLSLTSVFTKTANSGLFALKMALALGASPIYLLGFDMHQEGKRQRWWHDGYKVVQKDDVYKGFLAEFKNFAPQIKESGVEVINVNPDSALTCFQFGELPEDLSPGPLYVSYYTPGFYAEKTKNLRLSLHRQGLDFYLEEVADLGSWSANTKFKAKFILRMLEAHPERNIVFLDADAVVRQYPALFNSIEGDMAAHYKNGGELLSGTLFLKNNPKVHALVKLWIKENAAYPEEWEQGVLQRVIARPGRFGRPRVKMTILPPSYCQIFDTMAEHGDPVIEHFQASRKGRMDAAIKQVANIAMDCPMPPQPIVPSVKAVAEKITVITPTGDRPEALYLLRRWVGAQTLPPAQWIIVNDGKVPVGKIHEAQVVRREPRPDDPACTLAPNLQAAFSLVEHDKVLIMEDDDWYSPNYVKTMAALLDQNELAGIWGTKYWHVDVPGFRRMGKETHASLSQTAFRKSFIPKVIEALPGDCSVDLRIWRDNADRGCLIAGADKQLHCSIKGLPGRPGAGVGHDATRFTRDSEYQMLKAWCANWEAYTTPFAVKDRLVIYTAIAGKQDRDQLLDPTPIPGVDYVCFTDQDLSSKVWDIRPFIWSHKEAVRVAKHPKILPHLYFPDHDLSIWADANITPGEGIGKFLQQNLNGFNMAIHRHPHRSCLYQEAHTVIDKCKGNASIVGRQILKYLENSMPHGYGLFEGGIICRRHHDAAVRAAMETWWKEIKRGSARDQISLPFVLHKTKLAVAVIEQNLRQSPYFVFHPHPDLRLHGN